MIRIKKSQWKHRAVGAAAGSLMLATASQAFAQATVPRWELFGGYSFLSATPDDFPRGASSGAEVEIALNVSRSFALFFSAGAQFNTSRDLGPGYPATEASSSVAEYMGGPRFNVRSGRTTVFAHGLVGLAAGRSTIGFSDSGFALGGGGGVDVRLNHRLAIRGHVEIVAGFVDLMETDVRVGAGLVVRLGR